MAYNKLRKARVGDKPQMALLLYQLQSPEIAQTLCELRARYSKCALPDTELRKLMDKAMGNKTLTEELHAMREGR